MIFKVDLTNRLISLEGTYSIVEFLDNLRKLIPEQDWKDWRIEFNTIQYWYYPTVQPNIQPYIPDYPITYYNATPAQYFVTPTNEYGFDSVVNTNISLIEFKD